MSASRSNSAANPAAALEPLLAQVRQGGMLAEWFGRAATEELPAARRLLRILRSADSAAKAAHDARQRVEQGTAKSPLAILRQCGAGCSACCYTELVEVTPLEALAVAAFLKDRHTAEELDAIRQRIEETLKYRRRAADDASLPRVACPLLDERGMCSVYEVRPLVCAGVFSLSKKLCESASADRSAAAPVVPLDRPAKAWTMGVSGGLQRAIVEAGLDGNLYELQSVLLRALETPNALVRWLRGDDIFSGCHCTDPHSAPRKPVHAARRNAATRRKGLAA